MNILFDQGTPAPLRAVLVGHTVETAYERGRSMLSNGDLLTAAQTASFDVFITTDQNLHNQQRLSGRLAVVVLPTTRWPQIRQHADNIVSAVEAIQPGEYRELSW
jgi:hypothetical protein